MLTEVRTYTFEDFLKFYERLGECGGFEFSEGQIWDKFAGKPVEENIIDFILSDDFNIQNLPLFQTMPTQKHDDLVLNLMFLLNTILQAKGIVAYPQKTAIPKVNSEGFREPDLVVVNRKEQQRNQYHQVINPVMLVEVLSKSTKYVDLGEKVLEYQAIESLQMYLIVWQDEPKVVVYTRKGEKTWKEIYEGLSEVIELSYFDVQLPLQEVYKDINFDQK